MQMNGNHETQENLESRDDGHYLDDELDDFEVTIDFEEIVDDGRADQSNHEASEEVRGFIGSAEEA